MTPESVSKSGKCPYICVNPHHASLIHLECISNHRKGTEFEKEHVHRAWSIIGNTECKWKKVEADKPTEGRDEAR